ncbi:unnamed protein product, partial [Dicrocoelium dendriticum]
KTGRKFNQQETIWLGVVPLINVPCFIPVFLIGVYYNGLLLNDLVAGIYHQSFVQVTTYGTVRHMQNISIRPAPGSPFTWVSNTQFRQVKYSKFDNQYSDQQNVYAKYGSSSHSELSNHQTYHLVIGQPQIFGTPVHMVNWTAINPPSRQQTSNIIVVNIWLIFCLAGAGCVMFCSINLLAFRLHMSCKRCSLQRSQIPKHDMEAYSERYRETGEKNSLKSNLSSLQMKGIIPQFFHRIASLNNAFQITLMLLSQRMLRERNMVVPRLTIPPVPRWQS